MMKEAQFQNELQILIANAIREDVRWLLTIVRWFVSLLPEGKAKNY
jgi:hypothetical protein